jgi:hypothetical protein
MKSYGQVAVQLRHQQAGKRTLVEQLSRERTSVVLTTRAGVALVLAHAKFAEIRLRFRLSRQ